jgi:hypothetical protein
MLIARPPKRDAIHFAVIPKVGRATVVDDESRIERLLDRLWPQHRRRYGTEEGASINAHSNSGKTMIRKAGIGNVMIAANPPAHQQSSTTWP